MVVLLRVDFSFVWGEDDRRGGNFLRQFVDFKNVVFAEGIKQQPSARVVVRAQNGKYK